MVPLYRLTGEKGNFRTYIVTGAPNGDWGKVVTGAPNGPPIHADWQKVQFLHLICYCCSKWSPYTGWLGKSAISAPTVSVVLQMVPHTCWLARSAISVPTLSVVLQMVPLYNLYWLTEEKCNFCTYFVTGALWLLWLPHFATWKLCHQRLIVEIVTYLPKFTILPLNGPKTDCLKWSIFNIGGGLNGPLPFAGSL